MRQSLSTGVCVCVCGRERERERERVCVCVCVSVCVCVRERETESERQRETQRETQRERERGDVFWFLFSFFSSHFSFALSFYSPNTIHTHHRMNQSLLMKSVNVLGKVLHSAWSSQRFKAMKLFQFDVKHTSSRLRWVFDNNAAVGVCMFVFLSVCRCISLPISFSFIHTNTCTHNSFFTLNSHLHLTTGPRRSR